MEKYVSTLSQQTQINGSTRQRISAQPGTVVTSEARWSPRPNCSSCRWIRSTTWPGQGISLTLLFQWRWVWWIVSPNSNMHKYCKRVNVSICTDHITGISFGLIVLIMYPLPIYCKSPLLLNLSPCKLVFKGHRAYHRISTIQSLILNYCVL